MRAFDDWHFRTARVMITRDSLQQLVDLTKEERFRKAIKELEIYAVTFDDKTRTNLHNQPVTELESRALKEVLIKNNIDANTYKPQPRPPKHPEPPIRPPGVAAFEAKLRRKRRRLHDKHKHDQNRIRTAGIDLDLLAQAIQNLPALRMIRTVRHLAPQHLPLGVGALKDDIGMWPITRCIPHSVPLILGALHKSGAQLECLDLQDVPRYIPLALTSTSRKASRTSTPARTFAQSQFSELNMSKTRRFCILLTWSMPYARAVPPPQVPSTSWIACVLRRMHHLRELRITHPVKTQPDMLQHLNSENIFLPELRALELVRGFVVVAALRDFLAKHSSTLQRILCVGLRKREVGDSDTHVASARILDLLRALAMPQLRHVELLENMRERPKKLAPGEHVIAGTTVEEFTRNLQKSWQVDGQL
ncbi:hypothetical protein ACN47E_005186 [Coniothyrium glycines]